MWYICKKTQGNRREFGNLVEFYVSFMYIHGIVIHIRNSSFVSKMAKSACKDSTYGKRVMSFHGI